MSLNLKTYIDRRDNHATPVKAVQLTLKNHVALAHFSGARIDFAINSWKDPETSTPYLVWDKHPWAAMMNEWLIFRTDDISVSRSGDFHVHYREVKE